MDIKLIIKETIDRYLAENIFDENTFVEKQTKTSSDTVEKSKKRDGKNLSKSDETQLRDKVNDNDYINVAAVARELYPDHTPEGAQSQLRKKIKAVKNDNGSEYHLKQREASVIRRILNKI